MVTLIMRWMMMMIMFLILFVCTDVCKSSDVIPRPMSLDVEPSGHVKLLLSEGGSVTCRLNTDNYALVTLQWIFADTGQSVYNVSGLMQVYPDHLVFPGVSDELYQPNVHQQKYQCQASSPSGTVLSTVVQIDAESPPRWEIEPDALIRVDIGANMSIPCLASGIPKPTLTWTRFKDKTYDGGFRQPVESDEICSLGVNVNNGILMLNEVQMSLNGYLICSADNGVGNGIEAIVMLQVVGAPDVRPLMPLVRVPKDHEVEVGCRIEGTESKHVVWKKDGLKIHYNLDPRYRVTTKMEGDGMLVSRLVLVTTEPKDTGKYTCTATNVWNEAQGNITLIVEDEMENFVPRYGIQTPYENKLGQILEDIDKWGIDMFSVAELSSGQPLTAVAYTIFKERGLLDAFHMVHSQLVSFLRAVEGRYNPVPFHNSIHAADILQSTHVLLNAPSLKHKFSDLEVMATLFACAVHDVDHPGRTDQCLQVSETIPRVENETRLEEHHLSVGLHLLQSEELDFLSRMSAEEKLYFEELVKEIVLGTDLRKHSVHKEFLKSKIEGDSVDACGDFVLEDSLDRIKLLSSVVHVADLSTAVKPFPIFSQLTQAIMQEFFSQGDHEKQLGNAVAPLCDRNIADIDLSQVGFIDHFVLPLWEHWAQLHPYAGYMLAILKENRDRYRGQDQVHQPL